jgi:hypothetical protein|eukprot:COSAG01_NODE_14392_length_1460_cov_1.381337_2_plen_40_part_00
MLYLARFLQEEEEFTPSDVRADAWNAMTTKVRRMLLLSS